MTRRKARSRAPAKQTPQVVLDALYAEFERQEREYRRVFEEDPAKAHQRWMKSVRARWAAHVDSGVTGSGCSGEDDR